MIDRAFAAGLAKKTLTNIRATLVSFMKYCRKAKAATLFPEDLTIPKAAKRSEKHIAGPEDIQKLFAGDRTTWRNKEIPDPYIYAYRFAVLTGLRPGELLGLKWNDLRGDKLTIRRSINNEGETTTGKNDNARRTISVKGLPGEQLEAQRAALRERGILSEYIFPAEDAEHTTQKVFRTRWQRYCEFNGIAKLTPYELRHTYVSVNDEMPDGLKKKAVGHSENMDTEGTYGHLKAGDLERIADYSAQAFKKIINGNK